MIKLNVKCNDEIIHNHVNYDSDEVNLFFYPEIKFRHCATY